MNELGKPEGKRSRGCRYWWGDPIHYDFGGLKPNEKGWTDEDWSAFKENGSIIKAEEDQGVRGCCDGRIRGGVDKGDGSIEEVPREDGGW